MSKLKEEALFLEYFVKISTWGFNPKVIQWQFRYKIHFLSFGHFPLDYLKVILGQFRYKIHFLVVWTLPLGLP